MHASNIKRVCVRICAPVSCVDWALPLLLRVELVSVFLFVSFLEVTIEKRLDYFFFAHTGSSSAFVKDEVATPCFPAVDGCSLHSRGKFYGFQAFQFFNNLVCCCHKQHCSRFYILIGYIRYEALTSTLTAYLTPYATLVP